MPDLDAGTIVSLGLVVLAILWLLMPGRSE